MELFQLPPKRSKRKKDKSSSSSDVVKQEKVKKNKSDDDVLGSERFTDTSRMLLRRSNLFLFHIREDEFLPTIPTKRKDCSVEMDKSSSNVVTCKFLKHKKKKRKTDYSLSSDWISQLPDAFLILILGLLPVEEAARTTILSRRWEHLWKNSFTHMDFYKNRVLSKLERMTTFKLSNETLKIEMSKYVSWVNRILNSHKGLTLKAFRVCFDLDSEFSPDIDESFNFALQKKVQWLAVELPSVIGPRAEWHPFPMHLFHENSNARFLTILKLSFVDVSEHSINQLLHNCPLLKELIVSHTSNLESLEVCGESLKLKCLTLMECYHLDSLTISAPNLTFLRYYAWRPAKLHLKNVPNLAELSFGDPDAWYDDPDVYKLIAPPLSQLETLTLDFTLGDFRNFKYCDKFSKLKQLKLTVKSDDYQSLPSCDMLLNACPVLNKLAVQFMKIKRDMHRSTIETQLIKHNHKSLKVLELHDFHGRRGQFEFASFLCEKAISYETIMVDTREEFRKGIMRDRRWTHVAKECVRKIRDKLFATYEFPPAKFHIL